MRGLTGPDALESRAMLSVTLPALPAGAQYQLAFVTSERTATTSTDIAFYNNIVARNAADNPSLPATEWKAWASTPSAQARFNAPTYADIPVYNLRGQLIAAGSKEFLHPVHRAPIAYDQFGFYTDTDVATGSSYNGYAAGESVLGKFLGHVGLSRSSVDPRSWSNDIYGYMSWSRAIYGISGVITVPDQGNVPPQVAGITATASTGGAYLRWQPAVGYGVAAASDYVIRVSSDSGQNWTTYEDGISAETAVFVPGLEAGSTYVFAVAAVNGVGVGSYGLSSALVATSQQSAPTPPLSLDVHSYANAFVVEWEPPISDGGSPITAYTVQYSSNYGSTWTTLPGVATASTYRIVSGLPAGRQYRFRVAATNAVGSSGFSLPSADVQSTVPMPNVPPGTSYQLIFVTSEERSAFSQDIKFYDSIITRNANDNPQLAGIQWNIWGSTASVNARDNAPVLGPVYNLAGQMVAANSSGFLYPTHLAPIMYDQFGLVQRELVATGSSYNGYSAGNSALGNFLGNLGFSDSNTEPNRWVSAETNYLEFPRALYGLSKAIVSDGGNKAPTAISISGNQLEADADAGALVGRLSADDSDAGDTHSFSLIRGAGDTHNSLFEIVGDELRVATPASLPSEAATLSVRVRAKDQRGFPVEGVLAMVLNPSGITVEAGEAVIDPTPRTGDYRLVKRGAGRLIVNQANSHNGGTVVEDGELVVRNASALGLGGLEVGANARVILEVGYDAVALQSLSLNATGRIDVGTGRISLAAGSFDLSTIRQLLASGRNGGTWDGGQGITSRSAGANTKRAIGYVVSGGALTLGWAAYGDLNLDGRVNTTDFSLLTGGGRFNRPGSDSVWSQGDFNYDGRVNTTDISLLTQTALFNRPSYRTGSGTVAAVTSTGTPFLQAAAWYAIHSEQYSTEVTKPKSRLR